MIRPKLLALDLDGTLLEPLHPVRPRVVERVEQAQRAGVRVTLVSGRMYVGMEPLVRLFTVSGPIICYQGAVIADAQSGHFEREVPLANAVALRVYFAAKPRGYHVQFYRDDRFYVEQRNKYTDLYARISGAEPVVVPSLPEAFDGHDSTKVNIVTDPEKTPECFALMKEVCGDDAYVTRSNPEFVEMLSPKVDKGTALRQVADKLGFSLEDVMAIGDSFNDVPLLQAAGFGVAMGSAPPELRAQADAVVGDVEHDGVAEAIERFILTPPDRRSLAG